MPVIPGRECIVCVREADVRPAVVVPAAVKLIGCVGCGARVYASRSTRERVAAGSQPVCPGCLPPGLVWGGLTAAGAEELREFDREHVRRN